MKYDAFKLFMGRIAAAWLALGNTTVLLVLLLKLHVGFRKKIHWFG